MTLPESITKIGASAFQSCRALTEINIPSGLTAIEKSTFSYCRALESLTLPEGVTSIGELAFSDCSALVSINIPDGVTAVGDSAFANCKALETISFGKNVRSLGDYAFYRCDLLSTVDFGGNEVLATLGNYAFADCPALNNVTLPSALDSIGNACFYNDAALASIIIPESVSHVGVMAFADAGFYKAALEANEEYIYADNWLIYCDPGVKSELIRITPTTFKDGVIGIADEVFYNARSLRIARFPSSLRHVGNYAFYCSKLPADSPIAHRSSLETVEIADYSVKTIGDYAFAGNDLLYDVTLGAGDEENGGLESIGTYAFSDCARLDNRIIGNSRDASFIPDSVKRIGTYAFRRTRMWNSALSDETGNGVVYAGNWVVGFTKALGALTLDIDPDHTSGISDYAFYKCDTLQSVTNLNAVDIIGRGAFYGCSNLAAASLSRNLKKIEDYTFYKCSNLARVTLPRTLESIGRSAFYKCVTLNSLDLSLCRVTEIKPYAFYSCSVLQTIDFGEYLRTIGDYAFYSNTIVEELTIPDTVEYLGVESFGKNNHLVTLDLGNGVKVIDDYAFYGCTHLKTVTIPDSVERLGRYSFYNCKRATEISFGSGLKEIGDYAFYGIAKIRYLTIPENVESIGSYAFKGGNKLTSVVLPSSVVTLGQHVFFGGEITFYTDLETIPGDWNKRWNSYYRFVVWGCDLSDDGTYVESLTMSDSTVTNVHATGEIAAPTRRGYTFVGWAKDKDSGVVDFAANEILSIPVGTTVYSVWEEGEPVYEEEPDEEDDEDEGGGTLYI